jgi:hypothetical protein
VMRIAVLLAMVCVCAAETSVAPPLIGVVRDCAGQMQRVFGVGGAFVLERDRSLTVAAQWHRAATVRERLSVQREGDNLILHRPDGSEKHVSLPGGAGELQQMSADWLAAWPYAIKLTKDGAEIYRLPAPACGGRP